MASTMTWRGRVGGQLRMTNLIGILLLRDIGWPAILLGGKTLSVDTVRPNVNSDGDNYGKSDEGRGDLHPFDAFRPPLYQQTGEQ
jgi:hypothetical protein